MRRSLIVLVVFAAALASTACTGAGSDQGPGKPVVVGAFYPLAFAAERVGGPHVEVHNLTAPGVEPHDLEMTASQVRSLSDADLVVYLGDGFQPAVEDVVSGLGDTRVLDALEGHALLEAEAHDSRDAVAASDPHVWLDPRMMAGIVNQVARHLTELDPAHEEAYADNAADTVDLLHELDDQFAESLERCRSRDIVTSHDAFGYLAARYGLNQVSISGIDPEGEPSPGRLAEVARFVRAHDVGTIFFEELVSPDVAETIAAETGASVAMLNPLESEPGSGDYLSEMRDNLHALTEALSCE